MNEKQTAWEYILHDDGGANPVYDVPFLLPIGTTFQHEFGTYVVDEYKERDGEQIILCERTARPVRKARG